MKKFFLLVIPFLCLVSCDKVKSNLSTMKVKSEKKLDDYIFKSNSKIKIYDSKAIEYDTISDYYFYKEMYDNYILSKQYYELQIDENKGNAEDIASLGYMDKAAKNLIAGYNIKIQSGQNQVNLANTFIELYKAHKLPLSLVTLE